MLYVIYSKVLIGAAFALNPFKFHNLIDESSTKEDKK